MLCLRVAGAELKERPGGGEDGGEEDKRRSRWCRVREVEAVPNGENSSVDGGWRTSQEKRDTGGRGRRADGKRRRRKKGRRGDWMEEEEDQREKGGGGGGTSGRPRLRQVERVWERIQDEKTKEKTAHPSLSYSEIRAFAFRGGWMWMRLEGARVRGGNKKGQVRFR